MKEQIQKEDREKFKRLSMVFGVLMLASVVTPIPLVHFFSKAGLAVWLIIYGITMYVAILAEKEKKKFDMQTYKEIVAFMEGKSLSEIEKARESGKRPYQTGAYVLVAGLVTLAVTLLFLKLL